MKQRRDKIATRTKLEMYFYLDSIRSISHCAWRSVLVLYVHVNVYLCVLSCFVPHSGGKVDLFSLLCRCCCGSLALIFNSISK